MARFRLKFLLPLLLLLQVSCASVLEKPSIDPSDTSIEESLHKLGKDFILNDPYRGIYVEVDYLEGNAPSEYALEILKKRIEKYCDKPSGVIVHVDEPTKNFDWLGSHADWWRFLREQSDTPNIPPSFKLVQILYVPFLDHPAKYGFYTEEPHSIITVFKDSVKDASVLIITEGKVEATLLIHEVAHGFGVPARGNHDDGTSHCTRPDCALYKPVDWRAVLANWWSVLLFWETPDDLCTLCEEEIFKLRD